MSALRIIFGFLAALVFAPTLSAQTTIPLEMNIEAPHQVEVADGGDAAFSYDGQTLTPASTTLILCLDTTTTDIVLDVATDNATEGNFNALRAANITTHVSYAASGQFGALGTSLSLLNNSSEQFDLTSTTPGESGCPSSDYDFQLTIEPLIQSQAGGITIDEAIVAESLAGAGAISFSDTLTLTFTPGLGEGS